MEKLDFFHQPAKSEILEAKRALKALGCLAENGSVTAIGKQVSRLPLSVQFARMVVEADRLGVTSTMASTVRGGMVMIPSGSLLASRW